MRHDRSLLNEPCYNFFAFLFYVIIPVAYIHWLVATCLIFISLMFSRVTASKPLPHLPGDLVTPKSAFPFQVYQRCCIDTVAGSFVVSVLSIVELQFDHLFDFCAAQ